MTVSITKTMVKNNEMLLIVKLAIKNWRTGTSNFTERRPMDESSLCGKPRGEKFYRIGFVCNKLNKV